MAGIARLSVVAIDCPDRPQRLHLDLDPVGHLFCLVVNDGAPPARP